MLIFLPGGIHLNTRETNSDPSGTTAVSKDSNDSSSGGPKAGMLAAILPSHPSRLTHNSYKHPNHNKPTSEGTASKDDHDSSFEEVGSNVDSIGDHGHARSVVRNECRITRDGPSDAQFAESQKIYPADFLVFVAKSALFLPPPDLC